MLVTGWETITQLSMNYIVQLSVSSKNCKLWYYIISIPNVLEIIKPTLHFFLRNARLQLVRNTICKNKFSNVVLYVYKGWQNSNFLCLNFRIIYGCQLMHFYFFHRSVRIFAVSLITQQQVCANVGCNLEHSIRIAEITMASETRYLRVFTKNKAEQRRECISQCFNCHFLLISLDVSPISILYSLNIQQYLVKQLLRTPGISC